MVGCNGDDREQMKRDYANSPTNTSTARFSLRQKSITENYEQTFEQAFEQIFAEKLTILNNSKTIDNRHGSGRMVYPRTDWKVAKL